jgi:(p)ppGpp synthase/HD superfamily hydrolase
VILAERARAFATRMHEGQKRKYTFAPYITHCAEVAAFVKAAGGTDEMIAAAWLHDTVEDTPATAEDILREFGSVVARYVAALTSAEKSAGDRAERKAIDRARLGASSPEVKTVKLADLLSNLPSIAERDPGFAVTYMAEKREMLPMLAEGDAALFARVKAIVDGYYAAH